MMRSRKRALAISVLTVLLLPALAALAQPAFASGGDFQLDYIAAGPGSYEHKTGLGGTYGDRLIDKLTGVVESLEAGDFYCGDKVVFFTQVKTDPGATGTQTIRLTYNYGTEPTGQPGVGFRPPVDVGINSPDSGNENLDGNEAVSLVSSNIESEDVVPVVQVSGLDPGDTVIVRLVLPIKCAMSAVPTGNIHTSIQDARVVAPSSEAGKIPVGTQVVPLMHVGDIHFNSGISVTKSCTPSAKVGDTVTYTITVTNTGDEALENVTVIDSLLGTLHGFPNKLGAGDSVTREVTRTILDTDPDPLVNQVTASGDGVRDHAHVTS